MFACCVHVHGFGVSVSEPSALGRKGPNSLKRPPDSDEQPGPPFVHSTSGSFEGSPALSTSQ